MMINRDLKEKIRRLNPIQEVVNEFVPLKKNQGRCPKHTDKNPSFAVNRKLQIAKCGLGKRLLASERMDDEFESMK